MDDDTETRGPGFEDQRDLRDGTSPQSKSKVSCRSRLGRCVGRAWGDKPAGAIVAQRVRERCQYNGKPAKRGLCVYLAWEATAG